MRQSLNTKCHQQMTWLFVYHFLKRITSLIFAYSPTLDVDEDTKNQFYQQLSNIIGNIPSSDKLFLLWDFNARLEKDHHLWKNVIGKEAIRNCDSSGYLLLGLCMEYNLFIMSTQFQLLTHFNNMDESPTQTLASDRLCHLKTTRKKERS